MWRVVFIYQSLLDGLSSTLIKLKMSSALIWQLVKDHNSFLVKRGRTARLGAVQFSSEKGNLLNVNNLKYSGLVGGATVNVSNDLTLTTKV